MYSPPAGLGERSGRQTCKMNGGLTAFSLRPDVSPTPRSRVKPPPLSRFARSAIVLGVALRLALAWVNGEANDDHMPVIRTIEFEHRFPTVHEEWESFQPKLYHTTVAIVLGTLGVESSTAQVRIAQLIGCLAGLATLVIAVRFFRRSPLSPQAQTGAIAFMSLNPALIGINGQATNDSFVILFGTLALTAGVNFFRDYRARDFGVMTAASLAAGALQRQRARHYDHRLPALCSRPQAGVFS